MEFIVFGCKIFSWLFFLVGLWTDSFSYWCLIRILANRRNRVSMIPVAPLLLYCMAAVAGFPYKMFLVVLCGLHILSVTVILFRSHIFRRTASNAISIEGAKILFKAKDGAVSHVIRVDEIKSVGYMTVEATPWDDDCFLLVNSNAVTYMLSVDRTDVQALVVFLSHRLYNYNSKLGLANAVRPSTLTVWPESMVGHEFTILSKIYRLHTEWLSDRSFRGLFGRKQICFYVFMICMMLALYFVLHNRGRGDVSRTGADVLQKEECEICAVL